MNIPRIYVIIVTYNGLRWVDACFGSLRASTLPLHTIVVDNGSTDGTADRIAERFPEVELIRSAENLRFGRGNNLAIRRARELGADYYFLLNQDAWIYPDTIARLLAAETPDSGILSPVHFDGTAELLDKGFKSYVFGKRRQGEADAKLLEELITVREVEFVNAAAWLLPAHTVERVGGFDPLFNHYGEDDNYCHRVLLRGLKIQVVPGARICHDRQGGVSPLQTAWVGRYLVIIYADPRHTPWQTTRHTLPTQLTLLAKAPAYLVTGRKAAAAAIVDAYRNFFRRRREIAASRRANRLEGPNWL